MKAVLLMAFTTAVVVMVAFDEVLIRICFGAVATYCFLMAVVLRFRDAFDLNTIINELGNMDEK